MNSVGKFDVNLQPDYVAVYLRANPNSPGTTLTFTDKGKGDQAMIYLTPEQTEWLRTALNVPLNPCERLVMPETAPTRFDAVI